jgi:uncharacterized protein YqjF (DUF2071 family)
MSYKQVHHRPWPLPEQDWTMTMVWQDLLFAHWPVRPERLRPFIPTALELDTFDGWAWLGIVPFRMRDVRLRYLPAGLFSMAFPELNVRTYVKSPGRSGVWFFSLDATSRLAVRVARAWYRLPYFDARIEVRRDGTRISYQSVRVHRHAAPAELQVVYGPLGTVFQAEPGTLAHWLTERYCLYAVNRQGQVGYGDIHHLPWPLQNAEAEFLRNRMTEQVGVALPAQEPVLHFAGRLEVVAWSLKPLASARTFTEPPLPRP